MKRVFLFLALCWSAYGQTGNSLDIPETEPGVIDYHMMDIYTNVGNYLANKSQMESFIALNSYGRNKANVLLEDCAKSKGVTAYPYFGTGAVYNVNCGSSGLGWNISSIIHEANHAVGAMNHAGTATWIGRTYTTLDAYGDSYSPMGGHFWLHHNAFEKERLGFIGATNSLRPVFYATESGTYYITDIESQSTGAKCLKILVLREIKRGQTGNIYFDRKMFYYLSLQTKHYMTSSGGKKRGGSYIQAPAVQVRLGTPSYLGQMTGYFPNNGLITNIGNRGGLVAGKSYTDYTETRDGTALAITRQFTVTVVAVDINGATIKVLYQ